MECAELLKAMELDEEEEVEDETEMTLDSMIQDDDDSCQLPEEWVFDLAEQRKESQGGSLRNSMIGIELELLAKEGEENSETMEHNLVEEREEDFNHNISSDVDTGKDDLGENLQKGKRDRKK